MTSRRCLPRLLVGLLWLTLSVLPGLALAQAGGGPPPPLRVFLDCWECDTDFVRREVTFVDYMRDRSDADLHVLVTTQGTGGGGTAWTIEFIGLGRFASDRRVFPFTTPQGATSDDRRQAFARQFRIGLAGYAADTAVAPDLDVRLAPASSTPVASVTRENDPWKLWVFRVSGNLSMSGEASRTSRSPRLTLTGNRVTEAWKTSFSIGGNASRSTITLSDGRKVDSNSDSWNVSTLVVRSAGPRLSLGGRVSASHSSFSNTDRSVSIYPGVEFNVFPYSEFERRSLTIWWEAGPVFYDFRERTVFDRISQTVFKQQVDVSLRLRQPWGSAGVFSNFSQDVQRPGRYRASVFGDADVRLFKGFSFNVFANYARIKDQISLPRAGATQEEILLRLRQLSTDYSYSINFGVTYNFGSIFTSIVNSRFSNPIYR
jgi:hypothetical protein